ncbi:hypothetical protein ACJMK2_021723 [Sinanodonta woodiana]|uniref:Uncharacterized protein n=1 Tax=Sinanodonta woodiana TaxID=1069815 RepID=A0ABD3TGX2_SINWO
MGFIQFKCDSVRWGKTHDIAAKRIYQIKLKVIHTDFIVTESEVWVNEEFSYLFSSPDGLVTCKHTEESLGLIKGKYPFKFRNMTPSEAAKKPTSFCCEVIGAELKFKQVCYKKTCDIVIWTLRGYHVEIIFFAERFWILMLKKMNSFVIKAYIQELFSEHINHGFSLYNQ